MMSVLGHQVFKVKELGDFVFGLGVALTFGGGIVFMCDIAP